MPAFKLIVFIVIGLASAALCYEPLLVWVYQCRQNKCVKVRFKNQHGVESLSVCRLLCGGDFKTLWPKPTGNMTKGRTIVQLNRSKIRFNIPSNTNIRIETLWKKVRVKFQGQLDSKVPELSLLPNEGSSLLIKIILGEVILDPEAFPRLTSETDESYSLKINEGGNNNIVFANIYAGNFFGARHALETLSQLIVYDSIGESLKIIANAEINDAPHFQHRGVLLDTARHFFSVKSIKRIIDGMSMSKMNTFHWHMIDAQSFPFVVKSHPDFHNLGAYSSDKKYTHEDITDVVQYARSRGVRVIPEFNGPGHAGEGWETTKMTVCLNAQPWSKFCKHPPCGQLDPTIDKLYNLLGDIYGEMVGLFNADMFHMGGGEVSVACWNSSEAIRNWMLSKGWGLEEESYMMLWGHFQAAALAKFDSSLENHNLPIILWTSSLTSPAFIDKYLDKSRYIIQVSSPSDDESIQEILRRGYRIILSNSDALNLNCGFGGWIVDEYSSCSPYIAWQRIYEHNPEEIAGVYRNLTLGSEAVVWTELIDEHTVDARLWPRTSALAERLWSNPRESWQSAEVRLLIHRESLVENGITAESIEPEWCVRNQNECGL